MTVPDALKTKLFSASASFKQYMAVNKHFAQVIIADYHEGDSPRSIILLSHTLISSLVWVNGYHLASDLVDFQTANYARHFRQTVSRILAFGALPKGIQVDGPFSGGTGGHEGHFVDVGVFPRTDGNPTFSTGFSS